MVEVEAKKVGLDAESFAIYGFPSTLSHFCAHLIRVKLEWTALAMPTSLCLDGTRRVRWIMRSMTESEFGR